jgi:uncharacterized membrane protein
MLNHLQNVTNGPTTFSSGNQPKEQPKMQCPACHNEVEPAPFCSLCGAPLAAAPAVAPPPAAAPFPPAAASSGIDTNVAAAISYLFIPAIIFLLVEPYNKTPLIRFHSFQSIGLFVVGLVANEIFKFFPYYSMMWTFQEIISLGLFVVWLIAVVKAYQGQWFKLPILGDFAMKQAQS